MPFERPLKYILHAYIAVNMILPKAWLLLLYGLPTEHSAERVSLWRTRRFF
jgi:hypothetical protein